MNLIRKSLFILSITSLAITSCVENNYPKPKGELRLEYPTASYIWYTSNDSLFSFYKSELSSIDNENRDWINLSYPKMKAKIHISYYPINGNYSELIQNIEKLTYNHSIKASGISEREYVDEQNNGILFQVEGNAASNLQFYITDSTSNILSGSLYFYSTPNYDSLMPAVDYIKNDIIKIMESIKWKKKNTSVNSSLWKSGSY